jgi:hypothetical protein
MILTRTYLVTRVAPNDWRLFGPGRDFIAIFRRRKEAVLTARLLAGWRGNVAVDIGKGPVLVAGARLPASPPPA